jgi:hypothetical protein
MNAQLPSFPVRVKKISSPAHPASWLLAASTALLLGACVVYDGPPRREVIVRRPPPPVIVEEQPTYVVGTEVVADSAPPAPMEEVVTASPGVEFIWIPGIWAWEGRWTWMAGHWDRPPHLGAVWVPNHYEFRGGVHVFIRGGWR